MINFYFPNFLPQCGLASSHPLSNSPHHMKSTRWGGWGKHVSPLRYVMPDVQIAAHAASQGSIIHLEECAVPPILHEWAHKHLRLASVALTDRGERVRSSLSPWEHEILGSQPQKVFWLKYVHCEIKQNHTAHVAKGNSIQNVEAGIYDFLLRYISNSVGFMFHRIKSTHFKCACYEIKPSIQNLLLGGEKRTIILLVLLFIKNKEINVSFEPKQDIWTKWVPLSLTLVTWVFLGSGS